MTTFQHSEIRVSVAIHNGDALFFIDEAHVHQDADLGHTWARRGQRYYVSSTSPGLSRVTFFGAYNYNDDGFQPAVDLLDSGTMPLEALIEPNDIPLSEVMDSMERLSRGEISSKVMVQPGMAS